MFLSVLKDGSGTVFNYIVLLKKNSIGLIIFAQIVPYFYHK
jgi:hypothetical protein